MIPQKIANFFGKYPLKTFEKRQLIARAEEPIVNVFYLIEGRVSQYDITRSGNEVVVNVFKPGAFFPMSSAINQNVNHYFFEASTKTTLREAPAGEVVEFIKANPNILFDLLSRVYKGTDGLLRRMAHLMGGDSRTRMLFELINAAYRFGEQRQDNKILIPLNEGDIARHSGLARETVSRTLKSLKGKGIDVSSNGITIGSINELESLLNTEV